MKSQNNIVNFPKYIVSFSIFSYNKTDLAFFTDRHHDRKDRD